MKVKGFLELIWDKYEKKGRAIMTEFRVNKTAKINFFPTTYFFK